jgi:hypothetical protein
MIPEKLTQLELRETENRILRSMLRECALLLEEVHTGEDFENVCHAASKRATGFLDSLP